MFATRTITDNDRMLDVFDADFIYGYVTGVPYYPNPLEGVVYMERGV